jgi:4-hydroxy-2,2'-bipyrrole-5-carbaldehyde O-methyltransferase
MKLRTLAWLMFSRQGWVAVAAARHWTQFMRIAFLAAAGECGVLSVVAERRLAPEQIAQDAGIPSESMDAFKSWLRLGASLGVLRERDGLYRAGGVLAKAFTKDRNDAALALVAEAVGIDRAWAVEAPGRWRAGQAFSLAELDGPLVARSSRVVEPLVHEAIDAATKDRKPTRLLEVGCGSGTYIRYACERNPQLSALGLELQPPVAEMARRNLLRWRLSERASVEVGDVRSRSAEPSFDLVTLHNNIYYFPVEERVALLQHLRAFLRPAGVILITTACIPGPPIAEFLSYWGASTQGCGRCPTRAELLAQLEKADFEAARGKLVLPGSAFYYFVARKPSSG